MLPAYIFYAPYGVIRIHIVKLIVINDNKVSVGCPPGLVTVEVCAVSGLLATEHCPNRIKELFIEGTEPTEYCTVHRGERGEHEERALECARPTGVERRAHARRHVSAEHLGPGPALAEPLSS